MRELIKSGTQFDFVAKIVYGIRGIICGAIVLHNTGIWRMGIWNIVLYCTANLGSFLVVIMAAMIDGIQMSRKVRLLFSVAIALDFTYISLMWRFQIQAAVYEVNVFNNTNIDLTGIVISSCEVMAIFLWKQAFRLFWYPNKLAAMRRSIQVEWTT